VLQSAGELAKWSPSRTRRLAQAAYAIACAAADATRKGGRLVYATCALSTLENDGVVGRLLERGGGALRVSEIADELVWERSKFGHSLLPDRSGYGPMYVAVIEKS
jgi:16S rRNA C967 or C1407 C5-methylase (RsmB/RsmF family)